jgi:hypothetical protein
MKKGSSQTGQSSSEPSQRLSSDKDLPRLLERAIGRLHELGILEDDVAEDGVHRVRQSFHIGEIAVDSSRAAMRRKVGDDETVAGIEEMVGMLSELAAAREPKVSEAVPRVAIAPRRLRAPYP